AVGRPAPDTPQGCGRVTGLGAARPGCAGDEGATAARPGPVLPSTDATPDALGERTAQDQFSADHRLVDTHTQNPQGCDHRATGSWAAGRREAGCSDLAPPDSDSPKPTYRTASLYEH